MRQACGKSEMHFSFSRCNNEARSRLTALDRFWIAIQDQSYIAIRNDRYKRQAARASSQHVLWCAPVKYWSGLDQSTLHRSGSDLAGVGISLSATKCWSARPSKQPELARNPGLSTIANSV